MYLPYFRYVRLFIFPIQERLTKVYMSQLEFLLVWDPYDIVLGYVTIKIFEQFSFPEKSAVKYDKTHRAKERT